MNPKTTIAALLLAILLGAWYLVFETDTFDRKLTSTREREEQLAVQAPKLGTPVFQPEQWNTDKVRTIRITIDDQQLVFERHPQRSDEWNQTAPVHFPLQGWQVRDLINDALELRYSATVATTENLTLARMGLEPPRALIRFEGQDIQPKTIALGQSAAVGRAYLAVGEPSASPTIYVVGDRLHQSLLNRRLRELRATTLASIEPGRVQRAELLHDGQRIELQRSDERWVLAAPVKGRADREAARNLVRALSTVMVDQFVQDHPADLSVYGLDNPATVLTVELNEPADPDPAAQTPDQPDAESTPPAERTVTHKLAVGAATFLWSNS